MTDLNKVCQWLFNVFLLLLVLPQFKGYARKRFLMEKKELQQKITIATSHTEKHREKEIEKTGRDPARRRDRGQLNTRGWRRVMNCTAAANQAEIHVNHHTNQIMSTSSVLKKFSKEIPKLSGDEQVKREWSLKVFNAVHDTNRHLATKIFGPQPSETKQKQDEAVKAADEWIKSNEGMAGPTKYEATCLSKFLAKLWTSSSEKYDQVRTK
jgi:acetylornithine deacetylase/succinyl-diaminopimelate desuccinylase-like protein